MPEYEDHRMISIIASVDGLDLAILRSLHCHRHACGRLLLSD